MSHFPPCANVVLAFLNRAYPSEFSVCSICGCALVVMVCIYIFYLPNWMPVSFLVEWRVWQAIVWICSCCLPWPCLYGSPSIIRVSHSCYCPKSFCPQIFLLLPHGLKSSSLFFFKLHFHRFVCGLLNGLFTFWLLLFSVPATCLIRVEECCHRMVLCLEADAFSLHTLPTL